MFILFSFAVSYTNLFLFFQECKGHCFDFFVTELKIGKPLRNIQGLGLELIQGLTHRDGQPS